MESTTPSEESLDIISETPNPDYYEVEYQLSHSDDEIEDIQNS